MTDKHSDDQPDNSMDEKLALFVNGQLDADSNAEMQKQIEENDELAQEAKFLSALKQGLQAQPVTPPGDMGLARLMRDIEHHPQTNNKPRSSSPKTFWQPLAIAACLVLVVQSGYMFTNSSDDPATDIELLSGGNAPLGPQLQIRFNNTATAAQIQTAVQSIEGDIVSGPSALGLFTVALQKGADQDRALKNLAQFKFISEAHGI